MHALRDARDVYTPFWTKTSVRFGDILTKADVSHDRIGKPAEKWVAYPTVKSSLLVVKPSRQVVIHTSFAYFYRGSSDIHWLYTA